MSQAGIVDIEGSHPQIPTVFITNSGTAIPIANTLEILGAAVAAHGIPLRTTASGNTITIQVQYASAAASSVATNAGVASFDSADFTVDANGFVSLTELAGATEMGVDASTAPGTNPVIPNSSGIITVTGGQIAAGSTANVIRTNSLAANTYTIQIQRSQAVASSTVGDNGVSHFNSAYFTVDGNGFVSLSGTAVGQTITGTTGGALSPTAGNWNILGASTAAGTTPVQTSGSGSTLTVQVQKAQAIASTNATNVGLAAFSSTYFTVDANGFVSLNGSGVVLTINGNSGSATPSGGVVTVSASAGATVLFTGSGSTLSFTLNDASINMFLGSGSGNGTVSGSHNLGVGVNSLNTVTSGSYNHALGAGVFSTLLSGNYNLGFGYSVGNAYTGAESSNILFNNSGVVGESNVLRIGASTGGSAGQLNKAFISGINSVTSSNPLMVTINSATDQLGVAAIPSSGIVTLNGNSGSATGSTVTVSATSGKTVLFTGSGSTLSFTVSDASLNTLMGTGAGTGGTISGSYNTSLGVNSAFLLSSGSGNVYVGRDSGYYNSSGNYNTIMGHNTEFLSGFTGSYNACFGYQSNTQYSSTESSNININTAGTNGDSNTLRIGSGTGSGTLALNRAFISGIQGTTGTGTAVGVTSSDQLTAGGILTNTSQPAFCCAQTSNVTDVTGDGTQYTVICGTANLNQGGYYNTSTGVFTAPVTGLYQFNMNVLLQQVTALMNSSLFLTTTARNYIGGGYSILNAGNWQLTMSICVPMSAGDTAVMKAVVDGSTKTVDIYGNSSDQRTTMSGFLVC